jgi:hypothetical protein
VKAAVVTGPTTGRKRIDLRARRSFGPHANGSVEGTLAR